MGNRMDLSELNDLFETEVDFELTDVQYEERVKKPLPQTASCKKRGSPLRRKSEEVGYEFQIEERAIMQRVIVFKKKSVC